MISSGSPLTITKNINDAPKWIYLVESEKQNILEDMYLGKKTPKTFSRHCDEAQY